MKSYEIIRQMSPELAAEIFGYFQREQAPVFKNVVEALAEQRKLRPVFVQRKPRNERYLWIKGALGCKPSDPLAAHLLQGWLVGAESAMLCGFLDSLGIDHEKDGTVEQLPESPAKEQLNRSIEQLLSQYSAEKVAVYLQAFYDMDSSVTWLPLGELLAENGRLRLAAG